MPEPVIVAAARSPIGRAAKGSLVDVRPDDMAAFAVNAAMDKVPELDHAEVEDLMLGCGLPGGEQGYNMGRVVATLLGWDTVPGTTITRYCASSTQTMRMAAHAIKAGEGDVFIAAGVEAVSRYVNGNSDSGPKNPKFDEARARTEKAAEEGADGWEPPEGLPDIYIPMGQTAENVALAKGVSRERMDEFAALSQNRAVENQKNGFWDAEITPFPLPDGTMMAADDGPRPGTTSEKLAGLKPVFRPDGRITAGNACPLNDGAAAVVVMSDTRARELGIEPLARIISTGVTALNPEIMGLGPVEASKQALSRAGMTIDDVDLVEINEAFAAQVIPSADELGIEWDKLNVNGGSIAVGHPFGMTGARIMNTLLNGLRSADKTIGLETMCVGGGQGMAILVERLSHARSGPVRVTIAGLLLFEACDVMDVAGPYEVLLTANRLASRWVVDVPFAVRTVSVDGGPVTAHGGMGLSPSHGALADNTDLHLLIVPGLIDVEAGLADTELVAAVRAAGQRVRQVVSVCTGAFLLEAAGLLGEAEATTHFEDVPALRALRGGRGVTRDDVRWAGDDRVLTAGGLSSGIAMALHLVEDVAGRGLAEATARQIDHVWTRDR